MRGDVLVVSALVIGATAFLGYELFVGHVSPDGSVRSCAAQDAAFRIVVQKAREKGLPETLIGLMVDDWNRLSCAERTYKLADLVKNGVGT